jgi:hypothetical protein
MYSTQEYYWRIRERRANLIIELRESLHQPKGDVAILVSIDNPAKGITAGRVVAVSLDQAARLIVEGTHSLADARQAEELQRKPKQAFQDVEIPAKAPFVVTQQEKNQ